MDHLDLSTPAYFFPAVSLIMLSYTMLFLGLASVIRKLHREYRSTERKPDLHNQIKNLRYRLTLVKNMQALAILCFFSCLICMFFIMFQLPKLANLFFTLGGIAFVVSLILYFVEINVSTKAIEIQLSDMDEM